MEKKVSCPRTRVLHSPLPSTPAERRCLEGTGAAQPAEWEGAEMFPYVYLFEGRVHVIKAARAHELKQDCSTLLHGAEFNISHFAQHVRGLS